MASHTGSLIKKDPGKIRDPFYFITKQKLLNAPNNSKERRYKYMSLQL